MSLNFFLEHRKTKQRLHIGSSSFGWSFALHIYFPGDIPSDVASSFEFDQVETLNDWHNKFLQAKYRIVDEEGRYLTTHKMMAVITQRGKLSPTHDYSKPFVTVDPKLGTLSWMKVDRDSIYDLSTELYRHAAVPHKVTIGKTELYTQLTAVPVPGQAYDLLSGDVFS